MSNLKIRFSIAALLIGAALLLFGPGLQAQTNLLSNPTWSSGDNSNWMEYEQTGTPGDFHFQASGVSGVYSVDGGPYYLVNYDTSAYNVSDYQTINEPMWTAGQGFTASVWAEDTSGASSQLLVQDGFGGTNLCPATSIPAGTGGWNLYLCSGTVPSDGTLTFVLNGAGAADAWTTWDKASLTLNPLANPTWATGDNTGWTESGLSEYFHFQASGVSGVYSVDGGPYYLVTWDTSSFNAKDYQTVTEPTSMAGQSFTASVWAETEPSVTSTSSQLIVEDGFGTTPALCTTSIPSETGAWNLYTCTGTVPSDGRLTVILNGVSTAGNAWTTWDNPSLTFNQLSNPTWTGGDNTSWSTNGTLGDFHVQATGVSGVYSENGGPFYLVTNNTTDPFSDFDYQTFTGQQPGQGFIASVWADYTSGATSKLMVEDGFGGTTLCSTFINSTGSGWSLYTCSGAVPSDGQVTLVLNGAGAADGWTAWDNTSLSLTYSPAGLYGQWAAAGMQQLQQQWYTSTPPRTYSPYTGVWLGQVSPGYGDEMTTATLANYEKVTGDTSYYSVLSSIFSNVNSDPSFTAYWYDDTAWWALDLIQAYDVTGNASYLTTAESLFDYLITPGNAWDTSACGGGVWVDKPGVVSPQGNTYKNADANEGFLTLAAKLANRTTGTTSINYLDWARTEWSWFEASGMINGDNLINDGLTIDSENSAICTNNGRATWTDNQGIILGGLAELYRAVGDSTLLTQAEAIANAVQTNLVTSGILSDDVGLTESGATWQEDVSNSLGSAILMFKGQYIRNLMELYAVLPDTDPNRASYRAFIYANANSIWKNDSNGSVQFGGLWEGPFATDADSYDGVGTVDGSRQGDALDALVAAAAMQ